MAKSDKSKDESAKTAGDNKSNETQTTEDEAKKANEQPTEPEATGDTDVEGAASGEVAGGVERGDTGEAFDEDVEVEESLDGALGTVVEADAEGHSYDVPYTYLTADHLPKPRTSDSDDPGKSWTAQEASGERKDEDGEALTPVALTGVQAEPGQTFRARELPNRAVAEKAGIDYDQWVAGLPVRPDVPHEAARRGTPA